MKNLLFRLVCCSPFLVVLGFAQGIDAFGSPNGRHRKCSKPLTPTRTTRCKNLAQSSTSCHALSATSITSFLLRGGAAAGKQALDYQQEGFKLESMSKYSTITALVMNAALRLYGSQKFNIDLDENGDRPRSVQILESIFTASSVTCIVSGVFTAVLFNVLGIYSKEALGVGNEVGYLAFQHATAIYRKWGFRTFLVTCLSFLTSFLTSVVEKTSNEDKVGVVILIASIILALVGVFHIHTILTLATKYIYTPDVCAKHHIA